MTDISHFRPLLSTSVLKSSVFYLLLAKQTSAHNLTMDSETTIDKEKLWNDVLESIKVSVSSANFTTWFKQTHLSLLKKTDKRYIAEIGCASAYVKSTIETRYLGIIQDNLSRSLELPCDTIFSVKQDPKTKTANELSSPLFEQLKRPSLKKQSPEKLKKAGLRFGLTFKNFAVSSSNQMAWAASEAVANEPASAYNPLFIWGGVGVGKTHLMNAVGYFLLKKNPDAKVTFCTGEQFTNDIVEGIRKKTTAEVRNKYRKAKALMIDDIQFIAGKDAVQEEFFHTFNSLVASGAQIIMTSDQPPSEIAKLEERLKSRFEAGLIIDISPPDF